MQLCRVRLSREDNRAEDAEAVRREAQREQGSEGGQVSTRGVVP